MILSFIVPIYNVEQFLRVCLDSLLEQDIPHTEYEIICVNDCSSDNSREIVLNYQNKYSNIQLIDHEVNKKVGGARNTGLKAAKGKYIWFIDSDDYIYPNVLIKMISNCEENELDLFCFNIEKVSEEGVILKKEEAFNTFERPLTGIEFLKRTFGDSIIYHLGYPIRAIYRRDHLIEKNLYFPEHVSYGEETIYLARAIVLAQKVASTNESFYLYRQTSSSITMDLMNFKGKVVYQSVFCAAIYVKEFEEELYNINSELASLLHYGVSFFVNRLLVRALRCNLKERIILFSQIKQNKKNISKLIPYMTITNQFICTFSIISLMLITFISPFYKLRKANKESYV